MPVRRSVSAAVVAVVIGACAVGSSVATADEGGKSASKHSKHGGGTTWPDRIALDALGDADRGVDIQSLAVFNRAKLDFVGLSITGRDFRLPTSRSVEIYLDTQPHSNKPNYRIAASNRVPGDGPSRVRIYRVNGWSAHGQKRVDCGQLAVQFDIENQSQIRIAIPRKCLRSATGKLSVNASVWGEHPAAWGKHPHPNKHTDIVPDAEQLTPPT